MDEDVGQERRRESPLVFKDLKNELHEHSKHCVHAQDVRDVQTDIKELWKKIIVIELLDHRVSAVESVLSDIKIAINTTMQDIHKIQAEIAADNLLQKWVGRIVIAVISAGITFLTAKYA